MFEKGKQRQKQGGGQSTRTGSSLMAGRKCIASHSGGGGTIPGVTVNRVLSQYVTGLQRTGAMLRQEGWTANVSVQASPVNFQTYAWFTGRAVQARKMLMGGIALEASRTGSKLLDWPIRTGGVNGRASTTQDCSEAFEKSLMKCVTNRFDYTKLGKKKCIKKQGRFQQRGVRARGKGVHGRGQFNLQYTTGLTRASFKYNKKTHNIQYHAFKN